MARDKELPLSKKDRKRKKQQKMAKRQLAAGRILIVCEGKKTEPNYFIWWQKQLEKIRQVAMSRSVGGIDVHNYDYEIDVKGVAMNTMSLVKKTMELKNQASIDYTEVWCVFDRDSFPPRDYNSAIDKARDTKDYKAAYSNEAFELWYLLHFDYVNTGVGRDQYKKKLTERLGEEYKKNDQAMYEKLHKHPKADQRKAIENARKLKSRYGESRKYADQNPSTTVFELVESLNDHVWRFRCQVAPEYSLPYPNACKVKGCKNSTQPPPPYSCQNKKMYERLSR